MVLITFTIFMGYGTEWRLIHLFHFSFCCLSVIMHVVFGADKKRSQTEVKNRSPKAKSS